MLDLSFIGNLLIIVYLTILSILDIKSYNKKKGYLPAVLTSSLILITFLMSSNWFFGILAALMGIVLADIGLWDGIADYKVFVALGFMLPTIGHFLMFIGLMFIFVSAISFVKLVIKKQKRAIYPFIPVLTLAYLITIIINP